MGIWADGTWLMIVDWWPMGWHYPAYWGLQLAIFGIPLNHAGSTEGRCGFNTPPASHLRGECDLLLAVNFQGYHHEVHGLYPIFRQIQKITPGTIGTKLSQLKFRQKKYTNKWYLRNGFLGWPGKTYGKPWFPIELLHIWDGDSKEPWWKFECSWAGNGDSPFFYIESELDMNTVCWLTLFPLLSIRCLQPFFFTWIGQNSNAIQLLRLPAYFYNIV